MRVIKCIFLCSFEPVDSLLFVFSLHLICLKRTTGLSVLLASPNVNFADCGLMAIFNVFITFILYKWVVKSRSLIMFYLKNILFCKDT